MITNGKIVDDILKSGNIDLMIENIDSIIFLLGRFGKNIKSETILNKIKEIDNDLYESIVSRERLGKLNKKDLNKILLGIKQKSKTYIKTFDVKISQANMGNQVSEFLTSKMGKVNVNVSNAQNVGLDVSGEGRYFKRTFDGDLDKLLD